MLKLGAHVSISDGYTNSLQKIHEMGGSSLQIFSSSPRGWNFAKISDEEARKFVTLKTKLTINPVYFHASYLINLADNGRIGHLSKLSLISELDIAPKLNIKGSIIHLGSFKDNENSEKYETLITHIQEILKKSPPESLFIIENAGNNKIGQDLKQIASIVKDVDNDRVRICLDTCHLYSAGYDLSSSEKLEQFLKQFDSLIGLRKLELFHFNDSKDPFDSGRDRHENIGKGSIPIDEFRLIMNHPKLNSLAFIIEVPGFDNEGPDKKNLDILKSLVLL